MDFLLNSFLNHRHQKIGPALELVGLQNSVDVTSQFMADEETHLDFALAHVSACGCRAGFCARGNWAWCDRRRRAAPLIARPAYRRNVKRFQVIPMVVISSLTSAINAGARLCQGELTGGDGLFDRLNRQNTGISDGFVATPAAPGARLSLMRPTAFNAITRHLLGKSDRHSGHRPVCWHFAPAHCNQRLPRGKARVFGFPGRQFADDGLLTPAELRDLLLLPALCG